MLFLERGRSFEASVANPSRESNSSMCHCASNSVFRLDAGPELPAGSVSGQTPIANCIFILFPLTVNDSVYVVIFRTPSHILEGMSFLSHEVLGFPPWFFLCGVCK